MVKGNDIEERLIDFAVRIIMLCENLPSSRTGNHIVRQLMRSGTSPAANYAEARVAESPKDFTHKLGIALKELRESNIWLQIILRSDLQPENKLSSIIPECDQLCKIIYTSIYSSKRNSQR